MSHFDFICANFEVLAREGNSVFFLAYGEPCCEINGTQFACESVEEFFDLVDFFGDEDFSE